jgi:hypothetical protein
MTQYGAMVACLCLVLAVACSTRTPEPPTGTRLTFQPPTSPNIVVDNFRNSIIEKNTENFILCLSDATSRSRYAYSFEPSAEVAARYGTLFLRWSPQAERQAFLSLISRLPQEQAPSLDLTSFSTAFSSPDSTVYVMEYILRVNHGITAIPQSLAGTMVLTITPEASGLWSISSWRDAKRPTDTTESTWSLLKAQFSN